MKENNYHIIANPLAGHGIAKDLVPELHKIFAKQEKELEVHFTKHSRHGIELAEALARSGAHHILALGGDGTAFETLNGIMRSNRHSTICMGILPIGTGNAFVQDFGIVRCQDALKRIFHDSRLKVDVGKVLPKNGENQRPVYFLNSMLFGAFAEACRLKHSGFRVMGKQSYNAAFLYLLAKWKEYKLRFRIDGAPQHETLGAIAAICNSQYTGRKLRISPNSRTSDGVFEVLYGEGLTASEMFKIFMSLKTAQHLNHPKITAIPAKKIEIEIEGIEQTVVDGELFKNLPLTIENLHQAIQIYA